MVMTLPAIFRALYKYGDKLPALFRIMYKYGDKLPSIFRAMYKYGDDAPCYIAPKMLEEACHTDLRLVFILYSLLFIL